MKKSFLAIVLLIALMLSAVACSTKEDQAALSISGVPATVNVGDSFDLGVTGGSGEGEVTYTLVSGDAITLSGKTVTAVKIGSATVKATKAAEGKYNEASAEKVISVTAKAQAALVVSDISKAYGAEDFQLATTGGSGSGAVTFTKVSGDGVTITSAGMVTITAAGSFVVKATKAADTVYSETTSAEKTLTISKATQAAPAAVAASVVTYSSITLTAITGAEYKIGTGAWQDSTAFTSLSPETKYTVYARLKETTNYSASAEVSAEITTLALTAADVAASINALLPELPSDINNVTVEDRATIDAINAIIEEFDDKDDDFKDAVAALLECGDLKDMTLSQWLDLLAQYEEKVEILEVAASINALLPELPSDINNVTVEDRATIDAINAIIEEFDDKDDDFKDAVAALLECGDLEDMTLSQWLDLLAQYEAALPVSAE